MTEFERICANCCPPINAAELRKKVQDGLDGVSIDHFTDGELYVIKAALEIAGEL